MGLLRRLMGPTPGEIIEQALEREEQSPLEGTRMDLFNSIIPNWFAEQGVGTTGIYPPTRDLGSKVWIASRCQKLNAQAIASMPLKWDGPPGVDEPMWISAPDPNVFPNGIGDALHMVVDQMYGWGFSCLYVTSRYANTYPRTWTVLDSSTLFIDWHEGRRRYRMNGSSEPLPFFDIVQIDRNPSAAAHGTPVLAPYSQLAWGLLAAGNQSMSVSQGGIPQAVLKSERKLTKVQAEALQAQWAAATTARGGIPAVLPPEIDFAQLSYNPTDMALIETQQWNAMMLAAAYGIPGPIVNMALTGGLTYQNPVALMQMWWLTELSTTSKRVMDAFTAQLLPRGQSVWQDATDMTIEGSIESQDDPQLSQVAAASPAQQNGRLTAIGGGT